MHIMDQNCGFCAEINNIDNDHNLLNRWIKQESGLNSRVIFETKNFVVLPTLGSFVEGYLLVVAKDHYPCMGALPDELMSEAEQVIQKTRSIIKRVYKTNVVSFEHGALSCSNKFGGCLDHAHMHIVPFESNLSPIISQYNMDLSKGCFFDVKHRWINEKPYLFFMDTDDSCYFIESDVMPSQFIRQVICAKIGKPDSWDWRENPFINNLLETVNKLSV